MPHTIVGGLGVLIRRGLLCPGFADRSRRSNEPSVDLPQLYRRPRWMSLVNKLELGLWYVSSSDIPENGPKTTCAPGVSVAWCVPLNSSESPPATHVDLYVNRGSLSSTAVPDIYLPREENTAGMRIRQGPYDFQQARSVQPRIERKNSVDECRVNKRCVRWSCCTYAQKEKEWKRRVSKGAEGRADVKSRLVQFMGIAD